jgi:hypothetical protein
VEELRLEVELMLDDELWVEAIDRRKEAYGGTTASSVLRRGCSAGYQSSYAVVGRLEIF